MLVYIKQGAIILLVVAVFFLLLEGAARMNEHWHPAMTLDIGQGFDEDSRLFVAADKTTRVTHPNKKVSFRQQQFQHPKPPHTLRIIALGGSSVNYLDYEFSVLRDNLRRQLRESWEDVEIINCGGLSYGSHRLVLIAAEMLQYEPDLVLIYSGHNEFEEVQQMHLARQAAATPQHLLNRSALYRFIRDRTARQQIAELEAARVQRELAATIPDSSKTWMMEFTPEEIASRMEAYRNNLATIIRLFRDQNIPVIIGAVPSNLWKPNLPGKDGAKYQAALDLFAQGKYEEGLRRGREILRNATPRHQSSDRENEIIRELAREYDLPLADVEQAILAAEPHGVPGETLFNDHCHLNPEGNRILRERYEEQILRIFNSR